ncbi:MAG: hypothetical protein AAB877_01600 [Patescibacteria group bacterium]
MDTVNFLAQFWGFTLVIFGLIFLIKPKNITTIFHILEDEKMLFLLGLVNIILGILLVLTYNVWEVSFKTIITLLGWLILLRGVIMLFFPEFFQKKIAFVKSKLDWAQYAFVGFVVFGCALVYLGISA